MALMTPRQFLRRAWPVPWATESALPLGRRSLRAVAHFSFVALGFLYGFQLVRVSGHSMEPTLDPGQWLLVRRANWPSPAFQVGEVIVFRHEGELLVKRIAALPGQRPPEDEFVALWRSQQAARGRAPRLSGPLALMERPVPPGHLYVLGDNAAVSDDSRLFGPVPMRSVVGRVVRWPED